MPQPEVEGYRLIDRRVMDNDTAEYHIIERQLMADGKQAWVETSKVPLHDAHGNVIGVLGTYEDITERLRTEEALRQAQKMESLGVLAGGVAHDFNNLLVAMLGQTSLALSKLSPDSAARPHVEKAVKAATSAADLTRQLLAYSGGGQFERRPIQLNTLIQDNLHLFEVAIPKNVQLRSNLAVALPLIEGDTSQLQQVIMNLIINAGEAIGERPGVVTVTTRVQMLHTDDARWMKYTGMSLPPGNYVQVDVADSGGGMSADTLARIFDPFFTTKFTGRGLGLAAVLGIVRGHGGGLQVDSDVGHGTTFRLLLPVSTTSLPLMAGPVTRQEAHMSGRTILVIDDEQPVRAAVTDILEDSGLSVITAEDGEAGVGVYRERQAAIDLVVLDLSMPGQSGEETLRQLRELNPQVRVILSSGYDRAEVAQRFADRVYSGFIQKPYDDLTLISEIKRYLGATDMKNELFSPVDAAWLHMDKPTNLAVIVGVMMFDAPLDFERFRAVVTDRLLIYDRFKQRVKEPLLGLGLPTWEVDPQFDLDYHVQRVALAAPGDEAALQELAGAVDERAIGSTSPVMAVHVCRSLRVRYRHCRPPTSLHCRWAGVGAGAVVDDGRHTRRRMASARTQTC